jgi:glycosyltransferase involved in cell wall biosynthesis
VGHLTPWAVKKAGSDHFHTLHDIQLLHPGGLMMINKEKIINSLTANLYQKINVFFFNKIDKVISPSNWLLSLHVQKNFFPNSEKKVVFNPITSSFSNKNTSRPENKEFTFLYAGQIEEHKGVLLLIDAFKKLEAEHPRTKLKIVGDGSIIKKARRRAGGTNTIFTGRKEKVEIIEEMRAGDCLVVPSLCYENSPTVIYEATSAGLSILASDHGGIPELVSYFGGEIFEAGKPEKLAEKMENIYKNPQSPKRIPEEKLKKLTSSEYIKKIFYSNHQ